MANRNQPIKASSSKRASKKPSSVPHLKPLSIYSHKVFSKATNSSSLSWSPDCPSLNLKVELSNIRTSVGSKRRLDDSCLDETYRYETPLKKPCLVSSDSGCVLDSFDTFQDVNPVSLQSSVLYDEIKKAKKSMPDQKSLDLGWIDGSGKIDVQSSSSVFVHSEDSANDFAFDYDMDRIMCLSPIDRADIGIGGLEDFSRSAHTYYEESEGHSSWYNSGQEQETSECSLGKKTCTASDEGYVTKSYRVTNPGESTDTPENKIIKSDEVHFIKPYKVTVPKLSHDKRQPVSTPIMSTPLNKSKELVKRPPKLNCRLDLDKENWSSPSVLCRPVKAKSAISTSANVNLGTGNKEALSTIPLNVNKSKEGKIVCKGTLIQKSLACHNQEKQTGNRGKEDENGLLVSKQKADGVMFSEETDAADSFRSALPLQVKSNVKTVKATVCPQPEKAAASGSQRNVFTDVPRPVVLYREEDWEKEKNVYVESVKRHMTDNVQNGVMSELLHLMDTVANQERGIDGRKWQHPSDLTRRNYLSHTRGRSFSLGEWKNLNYSNYRRFNKLPQIFQRSLGAEYSAPKQTSEGCSSPQTFSFPC